MSSISIDLIKNFQTLGCNDEDKCALATYVYLDLIDDIKINGLERLYDENMNLIYFRAKRDGERQIIVPTSSTGKMNMLEFEEIQRRLSNGTKCVTVAICEPTSTILYYSVINDFKEK